MRRRLLPPARPPRLRAPSSCRTSGDCLSKRGTRSRALKVRRGLHILSVKRRSLRDQVGSDVNIVVAGLLQDLALLQPNERSRFGYKRAAKAIAAGVDRSLVDLIGEGTLREVPFVGKASERVAIELAETGTSVTVARAVEASSQRAEVEKRRRFRRAYLSRHAMTLAMNAKLPAGVVSRDSYRGDLQ